MEKQAQNIQEAFLNNARKDKTFLTIYLMSGVKLSGRIKSFDKYSVILETNSAGTADFQARDLHGGGFETVPRAGAFERGDGGHARHPGRAARRR